VQSAWLSAAYLNLTTTVEEEGDVGVLLRLGDVALLDALLGQPVGEHVVHNLRCESNGEVEVGLVSRHGRDGNVLGVREVGYGAAVLVAEQLGDLTHTVGAVVEEEESVVVLDTGLSTVDNDGLEELVGLASVVSLLHRGDGVLCRLTLTLTLHDSLHGHLDALPPLVPVHGVVPADNGRQLPNALLLKEGQQILQMALAALWVCVPSIAKEMHKHLGHANLLGDLDQCLQVIDVAVHTAVANQTQQMQTPVAVLGAGEGLDDVLDLVHLALLNGLVDADDVLPDNAAGADVEVTNLAVAHQTLGQADGEGRGFELCVTLGVLAALFSKLVHVRCVGVENGVALRRGGGRGDAPSVDADEGHLLPVLGHCCCCLRM
jgi:hypothetical protein